MEPFTASHIAGYDSHLPVKHVKLPLKYLSGNPTKDLKDDYTTSSLGHSEFIDISAQKGHFFSLIQAGITKDLKRFRLSPIVIDEATSLGVQFQALEFLLPHPIISKGTFTFHFVPLATEEEPCIFIDVLDESFLLMTFRIELSDFLMGNVRNRLVLDKFNEWVNISVPYSFELRSSPYFIKALDALNIIVSMNDGGLLHFKRSHPLSSIDIFNFIDIAPLMSLNFVGNLLMGSGKSDVAVDGVSANVAVDLSRLNQDEFVTLSMNKCVKVYNLTTHKQTRTCSDLSAASNQAEWLTNVPNKYFYQTTNSDQTSLHLMLPAEDDIGASGFPAYNAISWNISAGKLANLEQLSLKIDTPAATEENSIGQKSLKVQDFQIIENDEALAYYVLYKANTYSEVAFFKQVKSTKNICLIKTALSQRASIFTELSNHRESQYYVRAVFDSGMFDKRVVASALEIFIQNLERQPTLDESMSLRQKAIQTVTFVSTKIGITESSAWYKFALVCLELKRSSQEALSISIQHDSIFCAEVNGVGFYRKAHIYEIGFHDAESNILTELVWSVTSKFSIQTLKRILDEIRSLQSIDMTKASDIASRNFSGKILDQEIRLLMENLESIPNIVDQIKQLIGTSYTNDSLSDDQKTPAAGEGTGLLSILLTIDAFESIQKCHESLLTNLLVLLLLCEVNEAIIDFMNLIIKRLRIYDLMSDISQICFSSSGSQSSIEHFGVSSKEHSIFWAVLVSKNPHLQHILQRKDYNLAFDYFTNCVLIEKGDESILNIVIELINRNENEVVLNEFVPKMDEAVPINSFLIGITHLLTGNFEKFHRRLSDYTLFESVNHNSTKAVLLDQLHGNPIIHDFLSGIFIGESDSVVTKSNYFHHLSKLMARQEKLFPIPNSEVASTSGKNHQSLKLALGLETTAIDLLRNYDESSSLVNLTSLYLRNHFGIAIDIQDFKEATDSLSKLKPITNKNDFRLLFTKLMKTLMKFQSYRQLFESGLGSIYAKNYLLVDSILLELANEDLVLSNALKCYELLYSWRLLGPVGSDSDRLSLVDKRGAAEALYIFITRFKNEKDNLRSDSAQSNDFQQFKLRILELYKIIVTTLKTFSQEEDRWIRQKGVEKTSNLITLTELDIEHYRWLKDLERDFMNN